MEWYLARLAETQLSEEHVGIPGVRGRAIRTAPIEPGYSYTPRPTWTSCSRCSASSLAPTPRWDAAALDRERMGPGQVECTFSAQSALRTADDLLLFRTATRQVCRRLGCFATFMARPALKATTRAAGICTSRWSMAPAKTSSPRASCYRPSGSPISPDCSSTPWHPRCSPLPR